jgi:dienelactone hydrolase
VLASWAAVPARLLAAAGASLCLALAACGDGGGARGDGAPATSGPATTSPPSTVTTTVADARPYEVGTGELVVEDPTRPTMAAPERGLPALPTRTLPVLVLRPEGDGPFPVVVFAHGVTGSGPVYEPFLARIAEAGYLVAAPTFPLSSGEGGTIFDYPNQPGDVYAVLDEVVDDPDADDERVALAGHSLGAMTTVGAAFHSCCSDPRVDAAVALSGIEAPFPDGSFEGRPPVPLLVAHGEVDPTIAVTGSEGLFASATGPAAFLRFPAGGHSDILGGSSGEVLAATIVAWLDRWLLDDAAALDDLPAAVAASGVALLELRGV